MTLIPGSFLWLLMHDIRVNWRRFESMFGVMQSRKIAIVFVIGGFGLHLAAWPVALWVRPFVYEGSTASLPLLALMISTLSWMIAQSLFGATRSLFDRSDLDLLLGSPLPAGRIFAAKASAIAASTFGSVAFLVLPIINMGAVIDQPTWLYGYPVLIALALIATAIGITTAIGLFFLVGPRRARIYAQLVGAAIGGSFILVVQIFAMLPVSLRDSVVGWFDGAAGLRNAAQLSWLLWLPADAVRGDLNAILLLGCLGIGLFSGTVKLLGAPFARASLAAVGAGSGAPLAASRSPLNKFVGGFARSLRRKELRLLMRDPNLFAQLSLQIIYTLPVAVVLLRSESLPTVFALAPSIVVIAAQITASLAWITVSGEDAPELIATAPVTGAAVDRAKLSAVVVPVLAILMLPFAALAVVSWTAAIVTAAFSAMAGISTALLNFWHPMPGNRRGMLRRHSQSKLIAMVEHVLAILWGIAIVFALMESLATMVPVAMAITILLALRKGPERAPGDNNKSHRSAAEVTTALAGPPARR